MPDFKELVKNLYTTKNRELTSDKLNYILTNYSGKEEDFVKNFYATIGEELTSDKLNYISTNYLKKKGGTSVPGEQQVEEPMASASGGGLLASQGVEDISKLGLKKPTLTPTRPTPVPTQQQKQTLAKERAIAKAVPEQVITPEEPIVEEKDYFEGGFGDFLRGVDSISPIGIGDFIDDMSRSVAAGYRQGTAAQEADNLLLKGTKATPEQIQKFIDANKNAQQIGQSAEMQEYQKTYEKEGKGFWGVVKGLASNPSIVPEVLSSSLVSMATNTDALTAGAAAIGTGAGYGAATGALAGGVGAVPGSVAGAIAAVPYAFGLASSVVEAGSTFGELLTDELKGRALTKENVKAILENPEKLQSMRNKAIARGIIIGTVDALTGKLASGVGAKIISKSAAKSATAAVTKAATTAATAAGSVIESVGGSLGEAAARAAIGQDMDVSEIALEGIGELPGGIRSTIQARLAKPSYKVNGGNATAEQVNDLINTMSPADLMKTNIDIKNDYSGTKAKLEDKILTHTIKEEIRQASPELNEESLDSIAELEKELQKLEPNKTQAGKDKVSKIKQDIKDIQENKDSTIKTEEVKTEKVVKRKEAEFNDENTGIQFNTYISTNEDGSRTIELVDQNKDTRKEPQYFKVDKDFKGTDEEAIKNYLKQPTKVQEVAQEAKPSEEVKEPTIVVHATVDGYGFQKSEGINKEDVVKPEDPRKFYEDATPEQRFELSKGNSLIKTDEVAENGDKNISIVASMSDAAGRAGGAVYDFVIPNGNTSTTEDIQKIVTKVNRTDLKGRELINESVKQVKEYIDSNKPTTKTEAPIIEATKVEKTTNAKTKSGLELPKVKDEVNNSPITDRDENNQDLKRFVPFSIIEAANKNDKLGGQTAREISQRGGYSVLELDRLLPNWKEMLPSAEVATEATQQELINLNNDLVLHGTDDGYVVKKSDKSYETANDIRQQVAKLTENKKGKIVEFKTTNKDGSITYNVALSVIDTKRGAGSGFVAYSVKVDENSRLNDEEIYNVLRKNLNGVFEQGLVSKDGTINKDVGLYDISKIPVAEAPKKAKAPMDEAPKVEAPKEKEAPVVEATKIEATKVAEAPVVESPVTEELSDDAKRLNELLGMTTPKAAPRKRTTKAEAPKAPEFEALTIEAPVAEAPKAKSPQVDNLVKTDQQLSEEYYIKFGELQEQGLKGKELNNHPELLAIEKQREDIKNKLEEVAPKAEEAPVVEAPVVDEVEDEYLKEFNRIGAERKVINESKLKKEEKEAKLKELDAQLKEASDKRKGIVKEKVNPKKQSNIDTLQGDIEYYQGKIEDAQEELKSNIPYNYNEEVAEIKAKIEEVKKSKLSKQEKIDAIDDLKSDLENTKEERDNLIEAYNDDIKDLKSEIKKSQKQLDKLSGNGISLTNKSSIDNLKTSIKDSAKIKIIEAAQKAITTLKSVLPNFDIVVHEDEDSYNTAMVERNGMEGSAGNFSYGVDESGNFVGRIDINLSKANARTVAHEVAHGIMLKTFGDNPKLFKTFRDKIATVLKGSSNKALMDFANQYVDSEGNLSDVTYEEYLAELTGALVTQEEKLSATTLQKIAEVINQLVSKITNGKLKPFENTKDTKQVIDFFNNISESIRTGQDIIKLDEDFSGLLYEPSPLNINGKLKEKLPDSGRKPISKSSRGDFNLVPHPIIDKNIMVGKKYSVTMSDHTKVGEYKNDKTGVNIKNLMGGVFYPYIKGVRDAGIAWASVTTKAARDMVMNSINQDYTLIYRMARATGSRGNVNFNGIAYDELTAPVNNKKVTEEEFLSKLNNKLNTVSKGTQLSSGKYILDKYGVDTSEELTINKTEVIKVKNKEGKLVNKTVKVLDENGNTELIKVTKKELPSLDVLKKGLQKESFSKRGGFWSTVLKDSYSKKSTGEWYKFLEKNEVTSLEEIVNNLAEPEVDTANDHDIVAAIKIAAPEYDKNNNVKIYTTRENLVNEAKGVYFIDAPDHPSYPYVVKGEPVGILNEFNSVTDYFPIINDWIKSERLNSPYKAVETMGKELVQKLEPKKTTFISKAQLQKNKNEISKIIEVGKKNNISISAIKEVLKSRGFTVEEINEAFPKEFTKPLDILSNAAKADVATRKNKLAEGIDKIIEKGKITIKNAESLKSKLEKLNVSSEAQLKKFLDYAESIFIKKPTIEYIRDAYKATVNDIKNRRIAISDAIKLLVKDGSITTAQSDNLISKLEKLNVNSDLQVKRFLDYTKKVFDKADYVKRLSDANKTRKDIIKLSKDSKKNVNLTALGKQFSEINPSMVEDIDRYNEIASKISEAIRGSKIKGEEIIKSDIVNIDESSKYINEMMKAQRDKLFNDRVAEIQEFMGVDASEFSYEDMKNFFEAIPKEGEAVKTDKYKETILRDAAKKMFDTYSGIIKEMFSTGYDAFYTGEKQTFTKQQKELVKRFMDMDLSILKPKQILDAVDSLANFLENNSTAKMEATLSAYVGESNIRELSKSKITARDLKLYWSETIGAFFADQFTSLPLVFEKMFGGFNAGARVMEASGITNLSNKKSAASKKSEMIINDYVDTFKNSKPNGKDFSEASNIIERGLASHMMRSSIGTIAEMKAEFELRKSWIEQSIEVLKKGSKKEKEKAKLYQDAYDKILKDSKNINDIKSKTDKENLKAVDWWIDKWSENHDEMADVSLNVYNKILEKDLNYTPDRMPMLENKTNKIDLSSENSQFNQMNGTIYKKESGSLMKAEKPDTLPNKRYIDLSFDAVNSNAMYDSIIDISTASAIRRVEAFINSDSFDNVFQNAADGELLKERIQLYVNNIRRKNIYSNDTFSKAMRKLNGIVNIGVSQALAGPSQVIKQVIPVAFNTLFNAGRLDIGVLFNEGQLGFIDRAGRAVSIRGQESQTGIESVNKLIDKAANAKAGMAIKFIQDANQMWLKVFLKNPDVFIAKASWISYYEKSLKQQGIDISKLDYKTDEVNDKAADYAQNMVDRQQNVSDHDMAGSIYNSKDGAKKFLTSALMPFSSFRMNQTMRMMSDISNLQHWSTMSIEDRKVAAKSLAGFGIEMAVFKIVSIGVAMVWGELANKIMGYYEDDEEREKRLNALIKGQATSLVTDIVSPSPLTDKLVAYGANEILSQVQDASGVLEEDKWSIYGGTTTEMAQSFGTLGIAVTKGFKVGQSIKLATTGFYVDNYGNKKEISYNAKKGVKIASALYLLGAIGVIPPAESTTIANGIIKVAKKDTIIEF